LSAQGDEPDWVGDWLEIGPFVVKRMAALVIGAVLVYLAVGAADSVRRVA
jgi:hypothetical protein